MVDVGWIRNVAGVGLVAATSHSLHRTQKPRRIGRGFILAERGGFEPPIELPLYWFSKPAHSTALPPLLMDVPVGGGEVSGLGPGGKWVGAGCGGAEFRGKLLGLGGLRRFAGASLVRRAIEGCGAWSVVGEMWLGAVHAHGCAPAARPFGWLALISAAVLCHHAPHTTLAQPAPPVAPAHPHAG